VRPLAVAILVALGAASGAGAQTEIAPAGKPRLEIVRTVPLTIRGVGFRAGERVRILATGEGADTKWVTATAAGAFTLRLRVRVGRCIPLVVQAVGAAGSRAMIDRPTPDCFEP
jgi:hypothetical protein